MKYLTNLKSLIWLLPLMLVIASCVSNQKYLTAQQDIDRLKNDSLQLIEAAKVTSEEIARLNEEKAIYRTQLAKTEAELQEKDLMLLASTQAAIQAESKLNSIADDLDMFNSDFSQVTIEDGHVKLVMDQSILFDQGSTKINFQGDILLERLAATLNKVKDVEVAVEGHTDTVPVVGIDNNWDLSVDRSIAVIEKLTNEYGVSPQKLMAAGKSKFDPLAPNADAEGMAKNRRVEFIIIPDLESLETDIED